MTSRLWATAVLIGLIVSALFWIDPIFIPLALLGPIVIGAVAGRRRLPWLWPAAAVVVAGLGAVISDWLINHEDVGFHLALTVVMLVLATVSWYVARALAVRADHRRQP
jgi:uncharacterized membrane-anchored protein